MDVGFGRCGLGHEDDVLALARVITDLPGLEFKGLMFFPGHFTVGPEKRAELREPVITVQVVRPSVSVVVPAMNEATAAITSSYTRPAVAITITAICTVSSPRSPNPAAATVTYPEDTKSFVAFTGKLSGSWQGVFVPKGTPQNVQKKRSVTSSARV